MTLIGAILKKVRSQDSLKCSSPPPELNGVARRKKKQKYKYSDIKSSLDCSAPFLDSTRNYRPLPEWSRRVWDRFCDDLRLVIAIKKIHLTGGKVDSRWDRPILPCTLYFESRVNKYKIIQRDNRQLYNRLKRSKPRVVTTSELMKQWKTHELNIVQNAQCKFVLFPFPPREDIEEKCFIAGEGISRPRVFLTLRTRGAAILGTLTVELFSDICPNTCRLFVDLLDGDGVGYGYVGTQFFRKIPHMFWTGGDVIYDNGFGCYAQRGRRQPIGAENYHFSHSIPGLLSMRMTVDNEMCGIFMITFKPLPQLDLKNVVFGRVVRPCQIFDAMKGLGSPLSTQPQIEVSSTKRRSGGEWVRGSRNTNIRRHYTMN